MSSMYDLMQDTANKYASVFAIKFLGKNIKYKDFLYDVDKMASFLTSQGLGKGDTATIALPNIPNAVVILYALNKLGIKASIVHPLVPKNQLIEYMNSTNSKFLFMLSLNYNSLCDLKTKMLVCNISDYLPKIKGCAFNFMNRKLIKNIKYTSNIISYSKAMKTAVVDIESEHDDKECSIYLHSGGTTGEPKTAMLNNYGINSLALIGKSIVCSEDVIGKGMLAVLPIFHGFGLSMCIHTMFANGCTSVMFPMFNIKAVCKAIRNKDVHFIAGVPTMYEKLMAYPSFCGQSLKTLEFAFCGGDSMPIDLKERFDAKIIALGGKCRMLEGYGLTETGAVVCVNNYENNKIGSMGKAIKNANIRIVDVETKKPLIAGEFGEIAVSGDTLMLGYLNDEQTTKQVLCSDEHGVNWVYTGDYGRMDNEGYVYFKQRLKRIIKVSGVAIFPTEIESCVAKLDFVEKACAIGVDSVKYRSTVKLYVQPKKMENLENMKNDIINHVRENLIRWAVPKEVEFMEKLPLTQIGKVDSKYLLSLHENSKTNS